jgi:glycosyltransferase involved in cell wall biosynthesis
MNLSVDVVLATRNRPEMLRRCLHSLGQAAAVCDFPVAIRLSINSGCWQSADVAKQCFKQFQFSDTQICFIEEPLRAGSARNRVLEHCRADWIFFIDDDAFIEQGFFNDFARTIAVQRNADVLGGPNLTPPGSNYFQHATGAALGSRFAAARSSARYARKLSRRGVCSEADLISCNLFVRRDALARQSFSEALVSGEENWLMQNLSVQGRKFIYEPELFVWHERRKSFAQFVSQIYGYGVGRGQNGRLRPRTLRWFHLAPALSLLSVIFMILTIPVFARAADVLFTLAAIYGVLWLIAFMKVSRRTAAPWPVRLTSGLLFPLIHIAYGTGFLRGLAVGP